jgi:transposase
LDGWIESAPEQERDGVVRWRCRDLQDRIEREFQISFHERTIGKLLAKLRFRRLSVRPRHPESDVAAQAAFKPSFLLPVAANPLIGRPM